LELVDTYIDNMTGQRFDRPGFQRMLADMESGKIDACASKDLSRLGRSAIDTGYYIEKYFPTRHIRYIAINDGYDSVDPNSGGIIVSLKNMVNEHYAIEVGRKIHTTKQLNIKNGCFVGRFPPYGYLKSEADNHKLVPDPYAGEIVSRMFEMAANVKSVRAIADWLNTNNILPPKRHFHSIGIASAAEADGSIHWTKTVIYSLLKNRVYCGDMVQGKGRTRQYVAERLPEIDWVVTPNTHEPLVSREAFAAVQKLWEGNKERRRAYNKRGENIFRGKIFCGHCGYAMQIQHFKYASGFKCATRQTHYKEDCTVVGINEQVLRETLLTMLRKQAEVFADSLTPASSPQSDNSELRSVQVELDRNGNFLKGLYESLIAGDITDSEYREMKQSYEDKISALRERERKLRESARIQALDSARKAKAANSIGAVGGISDLTAEVIDALIDRILVFEDKHIEVAFKFAGETVAMEGKDNG
jgi:DNA invertase Pin-like site-specific DNA recombinase